MLAGIGNGNSHLSNVNKNTDTPREKKIPLQAITLKLRVS
jgi:hypothetical protein